MTSVYKIGKTAVLGAAVATVVSADPQATPKAENQLKAIEEGKLLNHSQIKKPYHESNVTQSLNTQKNKQKGQSEQGSGNK